MSELATRAKQLAGIIGPLESCHLKASSVSLIEQALLAERQSVWAAAIEAIQNKKALPGLNRVIAITALRAAAEKEVGAK